MGRGPQVRDILLGLSDHEGTAIELAQIGIEMNYVGLFRQAERIIERALARKELSGFDLYVANNELCISKYATGKFYDARALFRSTRSMHEHLIQYLYGWTNDEELIDQIRKKVLGSDPVSGKSILVAREGGFGDLVMHSRYLNALKNDGARTIYVETSEAASGIFGSDPLIIEVRDLKAALPLADHITWNVDLYARYQDNPFHFRPDWNIELFPHRAGLGAFAQGLLDSGRVALRIGILSTGNSNVRHEPFRSIPAQALVPLFEAFRGTNVRFYCLNKEGRCEIGSEAMAKYNIANLGPLVRSFADTASAIRELDLLISIDSGPAHLAGALNCPVWLLLSAACDYRWYDCQHCTPWYGSMRLYRQDILGDWTQPIENIIADLSRLRHHRDAR